MYEGEVTAIDPKNKTLKFVDNSEIKGVDNGQLGTEISYDYMVYAGEF